MIPYSVILRFGPSLVTEIDPSLEYVRKLNSRVHHVRKNGEDQIFRFGTIMFKRTLEREIMGLELAKGNPVPKVEEVYCQNGDRIALRKTFIPGREFNMATDQHLKSQAYELVRRIHAVGVSYLDLKVDNMIVNENGLHLPDFDFVSIKGFFGDYKLHRDYDNECLIRIFGKR